MGAAFTCIATNGTREMSIYLTRQSIMAECVFRHASRTEIFSRKHATSRHDSNEGVERGLIRILRNNKYQGKH